MQLFLGEKSCKIIMFATSRAGSSLKPEESWGSAAPILFDR